jgi:hypothetical protein
MSSPGELSTTFNGRSIQPAKFTSLRVRPNDQAGPLCADPPPCIYSSGQVRYCQPRLEPAWQHGAKPATTTATRWALLGLLGFAFVRGSRTPVSRWAQDSEHHPDYRWQLRDGLSQLVLRSLGRRLARPQVVILRRLPKRALDTLGRAGRSKKWHEVAGFQPFFERLYTGVNRGPGDGRNHGYVAGSVGHPR